MKVRVQLFARARDLAGTGELELELPEGAVVGDVRRELVRMRPELTGLVERSRIALDDEFAPDLRGLAEGNCMAVIPPVSGG